MNFALSDQQIPYRFHQTKNPPTEDQSAQAAAQESGQILSFPSPCPAFDVLAIGTIEPEVEFQGPAKEEQNSRMPFLVQELVG
eukprot:767083-Hanusia_phi.AAC.10